MLICARDSIWNTPMVSACRIISYTFGSSAGISATVKGRPRQAPIRSSARRRGGDGGGRDRSAVAAVLAVDVLDDLLAPVVLEVDVDIGRLVALLRDEALE